MTTALETQSVTKIYEIGKDTIRAIDGVSIAIEPGEFVALVGPSGSGKTTLLAMLAGLLAPSDGSVIIDGQNLGKMSESELTKFRRQKIGFTFQTNNLVPYLTVQENVELMLRLNNGLDKAGRERAKELLTRLGLGERLNALPRQLSGGQQQRVAIARALIHQPSVVLTDEPTSSLDTERAYQVVETFANLIREQNRAGIMVTHDLRLVEYANRVIQLVDGKLERIIDERLEIDCLANPGKPECQPLPMSVLGFNNKSNSKQPVPLSTS